METPFHEPPYRVVSIQALLESGVIIIIFGAFMVSPFWLTVIIETDGPEQLTQLYPPEIH